MDKTTPVILLTGWLGSGKTTLLNRLLAAETVAAARPALVVNEFGEIGVDGRLVDGRGRPVLEINKGSLFCICTKVDFVKAMLEIRDRGDAGMVLIEATGVAEAVDLETLLDERVLGGAFEVAAVLCVIDAAGFVRTAAFSRSAASQARAADLLVVNKTDLVDEAELRQLLALLTEMNPAAKIVAADHCDLPASVLNSLTHRRRPERGEGIAAGPPADIVSVSIRDGRLVDRAGWDAAIASLGEKLLRLKGNVCFAGPDGAPAPRLVELSISSGSEGPALGGLGDSQSPTAFTVIARTLDESQVRASFENIFHV